MGGALAWGCVGVLFSGERLPRAGGGLNGGWRVGLGLSGDIFSGVRLPSAGGGVNGGWCVGLGLSGDMFLGGAYICRIILNSYSNSSQLNH